MANHRFQTTSVPPLRSGTAAAEARRWLRHEVAAVSCFQTRTLNETTRSTGWPYRSESRATGTMRQSRSVCGDTAVRPRPSWQPKPGERLGRRDGEEI